MMTEKEARDWLFRRMGNDYFFLSEAAEREWVRQIMDGTFLLANDNVPGARMRAGEETITVRAA